MEEMETLSAVINRLQQQDYNSEITPIELQKLIPDEWLIDSIFRFEGKSNPSDNSILYALSKKDLTRKSLLVNAYGVYSDFKIGDFISNLKKRI